MTWTYQEERQRESLRLESGDARVETVSFGMYGLL